MSDDKRIGPLLPIQTSVIALQHLRYAVSAAEHGSFRRAAEALRLRQSTLSRRIRQLEESIGMIIFDRSSGGVRATTAGRDFLRATRSILEQIDTLVTTAHSAGRGEAGRLKIGFCTSLSAGNLRATLLDFRGRFPQVELGLVESSRTRLVTALRNGGLDLAIVTGETALLDGSVVPLWSERIFVVLPEGHPLTARDIIYWTDLRNETVLLSDRDPGPELEDLLMAKLISPGERPTIARHEVSRGNLRSLVGAGFGISLMTEASIGATLGGVIYREVRDGVGPARAGYSAHWREENKNPALASFLKLLSERYPLPGAGA
jgi:DNA-binding transcriptional LysR family regulator